MATAPALWRVARILRILGVVTLLVVIAFVASALYYAVHATPHVDAGNGSTQLITSNSTLEISLGLNLSNPGIYSIDAIGIAAEIRLPSGALIARDVSPQVTVGPGATASIPVHIWIPISAQSGYLLTHSAGLPEEVWANATFARLFSIHLNDSQNYSWGAPLQNFTGSAQTPQPQSNGTAAVPVQLNWQNAASFAEVGTLQVQVFSSTHASCGTTTLPVSVDAGAQANLDPTLYFGAACDPSGGSLVATFTGFGLTYTFPAEGIP